MVDSEPRGTAMAHVLGDAAQLAALAAECEAAAGLLRRVSEALLWYDSQLGGSTEVLVWDGPSAGRAIMRAAEVAARTVGVRRRLASTATGVRAAAQARVHGLT